MIEQEENTGLKRQGQTNREGKWQAKHDTWRENLQNKKGNGITFFIIRLHAASSGATKKIYMTFFLTWYSPKPVSALQCVKLGGVTFGWYLSCYHDMTNVFLVFGISFYRDLASVTSFPQFLRLHYRKVTPIFGTYQTVLLVLTLHFLIKSTLLMIIYLPHNILTTSVWMYRVKNIVIFDLVTQSLHLWSTFGEDSKFCIAI